MSNACDFAPCPHAASTYLRLTVDGSDTVLSACQLHADWLQHYGVVDTRVRVVDTLNVDTQD